MLSVMVIFHVVLNISKESDETIFNVVSKVSIVNVVNDAFVFMNRFLKQRSQRSQ